MFLLVYTGISIIYPVSSCIYRYINYVSCFFMFILVSSCLFLFAQILFFLLFNYISSFFSFFVFLLVSSYHVSSCFFLQLYIIMMFLLVFLLLFIFLLVIYYRTMLSQYRETTVGSLSVRKCPH